MRPLFITWRVMADYNFLKNAEVYFYPNVDLETGLTLSETHEPFAEIDGVAGAFSSTARTQNVVMSADVVLPDESSIGSTDNYVLFEHGGQTTGTWIGIKSFFNAAFFHVRTGAGDYQSNNSGTNRIVFNVPLSQLPEFDGRVHNVTWEIKLSQGTITVWIDGRQILFTSSSNNSLTAWSDGDDGGYLKGYDDIAGHGSTSLADPYKVQWPGRAYSPLRVYTNSLVQVASSPLLLDVADISFNQTFTDKKFSKRTLHESNKLFQDSNIKYANPANFAFELNIIEQNDFLPVFEHLVDLNNGTLKTFDLYVFFTDQRKTAYKINSCVITNGTFVIEKLKNLKLNIEGQGTELSVLQTPFSEGIYSYLQQIDIVPSQKTYQQVKNLEATIGGLNISDGVLACTIELENDIEWNPYRTLNDALNVTNESNTMYPSNFTLKERSLTGSIERYIFGNGIKDADIDSWKTGQTLVIKAGNSNSSNKGFQLNLSNCSFTNRANVREIFTHNYEWTMNDNPTTLGNVIKLNNT